MKCEEWLAILSPFPSPPSLLLPINNYLWTLTASEPNRVVTHQNKSQSRNFQAVGC